MKQSVGKEEKTNWVVAEMIKVCFWLFNYCFVSYEACTCFIIVLVRFNVAVFVLGFCYSSVMFLLLFYYVSIILPLKRNCNTTLLFIIRY